MNKIQLYLLFLLAYTPLATAQLPNGNFGSGESLSCPYDNGTIVLWPTGWGVYQTQNDLWDGPIDSSRCISMITNGVGRQIDFAQVAIDRPLFVRQSFEDEEGINLPSNSIHKLMAVVDVTDNELQLDDNCNGTLCSGIIAVVEIPDQDGIGAASRVHTASFVESQFSDKFAEACLVSEYFEQNILREVILKFSFKENSIPNLGLQYVDLIPPFNEINFVTEIVFPDASFTGESYQANLKEVVELVGFPYAPFLFLHEANLYPNPDNITYIEARPATPIMEAADLRVAVEEHQSILFQPYTAVRGALVDPNDTLRHQLTLVTDGAEICFAGIVELVVLDGATVEFRTGNVNFSGPNSCIMFRDGGGLRIPDRTQFEYGSAGVGALGLDRGGTIEIGENSELLINNTMILANYQTGSDRQVYMELNPNSRLTFGEQASLIRKGHVETGKMRLNVYMKGGILDDSQLSPKEKSLINRIYPEENQHRSDWLQILGNPSREVLNLRIEAGSAEARARWTIRNLHGQELLHGLADLQLGDNTLQFQLASLTAGMYVLDVALKSDRVVEKFVKIE